MSQNSKKYFSISEVSKTLGIPAYKLRYLEKAKPAIEVFQIRGRRYYTAEDIELIKQKVNGVSDDGRAYSITSSEEENGQRLLFSVKEQITSPGIYKKNTLKDQTMVKKIDSLISKLNKLSS